jgi:cell division protein FtsZ
MNNPSSPLNSSFSFSPFKTPVTNSLHLPSLKVLGLGGGGANAVNRMIDMGLDGIDFIVANTDGQALQSSLAPVKLQLGPKTTRGLGAGGNPEVGQMAAEESWRQIQEVLQGADMVFLTAGMGGGTGTGAIPVAAKIARSIGAVTIAVVTMPFSFEIGRRQRNASDGISRLQPYTDTLISIPNDRLLYVAPRNLPLDTAFRLADDVLRQAVQGITELITTPGMINVDFANIRNLMRMGGGALMSIGHGEGESKAVKAIEQALHHPLLETASLESAAGILVNFTTGSELTLFEVQEALNHLQEQSGNKAEIVLGVVNDERLEERVQVILVVTGLGSPTLEETLSRVGRIQHTSNYPQAMNSEPATRSPDYTKTQSTGSEQLSDVESSSPNTPINITAKDLDLPAFLRRMR